MFDLFRDIAVNLISSILFILLCALTARCFKALTIRYETPSLSDGHTFFPMSISPRYQTRHLYARCFFGQLCDEHDIKDNQYTASLRKVFECPADGKMHFCPYIRSTSRHIRPILFLCITFNDTVVTKGIALKRVPEPVGCAPNVGFVEY